jgi:putative transposase
MQRREAVAWAVDDKQLSQRRACRLMTQPRGTQRRILQGPRDDGVVESRLVELANVHGTWGCPQLHQQLRREGHWINHKRTHRLYRKHDLSLRRRRRRRLPERVQQPLVQQLHPNQVWSMDFMSDTLVNRRAYRTFNVIDDCARDVLAIEIDFSLTGERVVRVLQQLCEWHGKPDAMRSDNGPEFRSNVVQEWAKSNDIDWQFTQPGCPAQNAYIERFNGTFRVEVLDAYQFESLDQARAISEQWIPVYNEQRTHSAIGHLPPMEFKRQRQLPESLLSIGIG